MIVDPLERAVGAAVIDAEHGGPAQDADVRHRRELGLGRLRPLRARPAVDRAPLGEEPSAETEILVAEDHPRAGAARGERRGKPGRPAADDQHVAEGVGLLVVVRVGRARGAAEAGGAADRRLVELLPEGGRPHEGLVVEARAEEGRDELVDREQIDAAATASGSGSSASSPS